VKAEIFGGNGEEKGFGEVGTEEVEGKGVYMPRTWIRESHLSSFHWFLGSDLSPFGKYSF